MSTFLKTFKHLLLSGAITGTMLYGGGCSFKSIGAALLSEFLTSGGGTTLGSDLTSQFGSLLDDLTADQS
jgi:hypothetical protein